MARNDAWGRRTSGAWAWACAASIAAGATTARASGFAVPRVGDPHGHPALANAYAVHFNPAALGGVHGTQVVVDGGLVYRTVDVNRTASALSPLAASLRQEPTYVAANTGPAHAGNVLAAPFVAAASDFGTRSLFAGVGAYVPYGGEVQFDRRDAFAGNRELRGAVDGSQRWSVISARHLALYTSGVLGIRFPDLGVSLAVGTSLVFSSIQHVQARNTTGYDDTNTEGRAQLDVSGTHVAMSAGVYWEILPQKLVRIGLAYAVRPGFGEARMNGTLRQYYGASDSERSVELRQTYPDVLRFGIAARVSRALELRYDADYTTWSLLDHPCVVARGAACEVNEDGSEAKAGAGQIVLAPRRRWRDAGSMRVGVGYFFDPRSEVYASLGYETSAVPAATLEATTPDAFKWMGSLGVRRQLTSLLTLGASTTWVAYAPVTATGQQQASLVGASKMPNADGIYGSRLLFFNLNAAFTF